MEYERAIEQVFEHLENNYVDRAVMACLRIARHLKDYLPAAIFLRELYPSNKAAMQAMHDDLQHLKPKSRKFLAEKSLNAWLDTHTLPFNMTPDEEGLDEGEQHKVLAAAVGEIDTEIEQWERSIADLTLPSGMGEFDTAAFTDRYSEQKAACRLRIKGLHIVRERIKANCLNYAIRIERQLEAQQKSQGFLDQVQTEVNNYFRAHCEDASTKLLRATQLVNSSNSEDAALLLTEIRRAMKSVADFLYPPAIGKVRCVDGQERLLGDEQYLNRMHEFLAARLDRSSSSELLRAEFEYFAAHFRRLNDLASKGVHAEVTLSEAKLGLLNLYLFLHNVCSRLDIETQEKSPNTAK